MDHDSIGLRQENEPVNRLGSPAVGQKPPQAIQQLGVRGLSPVKPLSGDAPAWPVVLPSIDPNAGRQRVRHQRSIERVGALATFGSSRRDERLIKVGMRSFRPDGPFLGSPLTSNEFGGVGSDRSNQRVLAHDFLARAIRAAPLTYPAQNAAAKRQ